jgi:hypothetical protein
MSFFGNRILALQSYSSSRGESFFFPAFERERPRIVNNFAVERVARLGIFVLFREMNRSRLSNLELDFQRSLEIGT